MYFVILALIYVIFVGLGMPDSILGSAWPNMVTEFGFLDLHQSLITIALSVATAFAGIVGTRLINKLGVGVMMGISTALCSVTLLLFALVANSIWWMTILSIPLGLGAGIICAGLNNYASVNYKSSHVNFLHCFYGAGMMLSPYLLSLTLNAGGWRQGYMLVFYIYGGISLLTILSIPLWKKVKSRKEAEEEIKPITLSIKQMAKMPAVRWAWVAFFTMSSIEFTCNYWAATFFVDTLKVADYVAAGFVTFFFIGGIASKFLAGIAVTKIKPVYVLFAGYAFEFIGIVLMMLPLPVTFKVVGLALIGFGSGPTNPTLMSVVPGNFGKDISQSIVSTQMASANMGLIFGTVFFALISDVVSAAVLPYFLLIMLAFLVLANFMYNRAPKQTSKDLGLLK